MGHVKLYLDRRHVNTLVDCVEEVREMLDTGVPSDLRGYDELSEILFSLLDQLGEDTETIERKTGKKSSEPLASRKVASQLIDFL